MATLLNIAGLVGLTAIVAIAYFAKLEFWSVAVSFVVFVSLFVITHYGPFRCLPERTPSTICLRGKTQASTTLQRTQNTTSLSGSDAFEGICN